MQYHVVKLDSKVLIRIKQTEERNMFIILTNHSPPLRFGECRRILSLYF